METRSSQADSETFFDGYVSGLGVYVEYATAKKWNYARRAMQAAGFTIRQDAEREGIAVFDPTNKTQVKLALRVARVKTRRQVTPAQLAVLAAARQKSPLFTSNPV